MHTNTQLSSLLILLALILVGCNLGAPIETETPENIETEITTNPTITPEPTITTSATPTRLPATTIPTAILPPTDAPTSPDERCRPTIEGNGYVTLSPSTPHPTTPHCVSVPVGDIMVTWADAPADFVEVVFWTQTATGNTNVIGVDTDPSDGASTSWTTYDGAPPMVIYTMALTSPPSPDNDSGYLAFYVE